MPQNPLSGRDPAVTVGIGGDASGLNQAVDGAIGSLGSLSKKAAAAGAALTALGGGAMALAVNEAANFEQAMVEVEKVTNPETADAMAESVREMAEEMPLAQEELAGIAAQAGRFGVEGVDNMEQFTESVAQMATATDLSASQAGEAFARMTTLMDEEMSNIQDVGDVVNGLSNSMATSASEITDAATRSAGALNQLGLSSEQILSLNAAMNEVAPSSRRAGTQLRRFAQELQDPGKVEDLAAALGMSVEEFRRMREESPNDLMRTMITRFQDGDAAADKLRGTLSTTSRQVLAGLSENTESWADAQQIANEQMGEGTSLSEEYEAATDTFNARLTTLKNNVIEVAIAVGNDLLPLANDLVVGLQDLIQSAQDVADAIDFGDAARDSAAALRSLRRVLAGDFDGAFGRLADAADESTDQLRTALVGIGGSGGLTAIVDTAVTDAQQYLQSEGQTIIRDGMTALGAASVDAASDMRHVLIGPGGESGVLSEMVDQGAAFIRNTAPQLIGGAFEAIGSGIRAALIDITNPLRGRDSEIWDMIADGASWLIANMPQLMLAVGEGIVDAIVEGAKGLYRGLVGGSVLKDQISRAGTWLMNNMDSVLGDVGGEIVSTITSAIDGAQSRLRSAGRRAAGWVKGGISSLRSGRDNALDAETQAAIQDMTEWLQSDDAQSMFDSAIDTLVSGAEDILDQVPGFGDDDGDGGDSVGGGTGGRTDVGEDDPRLGGNDSDSGSGSGSGSGNGNGDADPPNLGILPPRNDDGDGSNSSSGSDSGSGSGNGSGNGDDGPSSPFGQDDDVPIHRRTGPFRDRPERLIQAEDQLGARAIDRYFGSPDTTDNRLTQQELRWAQNWMFFHGRAGEDAGHTTVFGVPGESPITLENLMDQTPVSLASGGFIERAGSAVVHEGERVVPEAQISDRGELDLDPETVAEGVARGVERAMTDDSTARVAERDLVRGLERLFDRHSTSL